MQNGFARGSRSVGPGPPRKRQAAQSTTAAELRRRDGARLNEGQETGREGVWLSRGLGQTSARWMQNSGRPACPHVILGIIRISQPLCTPHGDVRSTASTPSAIALYFARRLCEYTTALRLKRDLQWLSSKSADSIMRVQELRWGVISASWTRGVPHGFNTL